MDRLLPDPYVSVPNKEETWRPESIAIENKAGCSPIEIMNCFKYQSKVLAKADEAKVILPPDLYVPYWEKRNEIESKIIQSALVNGDTILVRGRQTTTLTKKISYLVCTKGMYHQRNPANKENIVGEAIHYKIGVKTDVLVNKATSNRGPQGKSEPRRTKTAKPSHKNLCNFVIQLQLKEGHYWYIKYETTDKGEHNHMRVPFEQQHRRMSTRPLEEQQQTAIFSQLTSASSAQAPSQRINGTMPPTRNQLHYNQRVQESSMGKMSQAQELIQYLQHQVMLQQKRYVALFHKVTETT